MKKNILFAVFVILVLLTVINYRTPILKQNAGPWSIGFGKSTVFPDNIAVSTNTNYSLEQLKSYNDSTQFLADPFFIKVKDTFYLFFEHKKINKDYEILKNIRRV